MIQEGVEGDLESSIRKITTYREVDLVARPDQWGSVNFRRAETDIELAMSLATELSTQSTQRLPNSAQTRIHRCMETVAQLLGRIDEFDLEHGGDVESRDEIARELSVAADAFVAETGPWVAYLG